MFWRRYAIFAVVIAVAVPAFFGGSALAHNVGSGPTVFRTLDTQFGTFCAEDEAWILHPGIYGLAYSTWAKTYDRTGLFCLTGYGPPAGQIYVSQSVYQTYQGIVYLCGSAYAHTATQSEIGVGQASQSHSAGGLACRDSCGDGSNPRCDLSLTVCPLGEFFPTDRQFGLPQA